MVSRSGTWDRTTRRGSRRGRALTALMAACTTIGLMLPTLPASATLDDISMTKSQPTVTVEQGAGQADPTNASPIVFDVAFSEPVTGFEDADVKLSGTAGATTAAVTGSGASYTVEVSGMTSDGTVIASVPAGAATDPLGQGNEASTSTDNTVTFDTTAPDTTINAAPFEADSNTSPTFEFSSTEDGSSFECRLDSTEEGDFAPCTSPHTYTGVSGGAHTFEVRATDAASNTDPTPATYTWTIFTVGPGVTITFPAHGESYSRTEWDGGCPTPGFCGTTSDAGTGVDEVTLSLRVPGGNYWDGDGFDSPVEVRFPATGTTDWSEAFPFADLPSDTFVLRARATDGVGNAGSATATFSTGTPPIPGMPAACIAPTIVGSGVVLGTPGDDVIVTEPGNATVRGRGGDDVICTGNGNDVIVTLGGDDLVYSSGGRNVVTTRAGNDVVLTRGGRDTIRTGAGRDDVRAGNGKNFVHTGGGRDEVRGGKGPDQIRVGAGNDLVRAGNGRNRVWGGGGGDLLITGKGRDRINGGPGSDTCRSGPGGDVILNCERGPQLSLARGRR